MANSRTSALSSVPPLEKTLADEAPKPFSLDDFTMYLKNNHCYEMLEFYFDVKDYYKMAQTDDHLGLHDRWNHITRTYISVDSPREINITEEHREKLRDLTGGKFPSTTEMSRNILCFAVDLLHDCLYLQFINEQTASVRASFQNITENGVRTKINQTASLKEARERKKHTKKPSINRRFSFKRYSESDAESDFYEDVSTKKANHSAGSSLTQISPTTNDFDMTVKGENGLAFPVIKQWNIMSNSDKPSGDVMDTSRNRAWQRMSAVFRKHVHS